MKGRRQKTEYIQQTTETEESSKQSIELMSAWLIYVHMKQNVI